MKESELRGGLILTRYSLEISIIYRKLKFFRASVGGHWARTFRSSLHPWNVRAHSLLPTDRVVKGNKSRRPITALLYFLGSCMGSGGEKSIHSHVYAFPLMYEMADEANNRKNNA